VLAAGTTGGDVCCFDLATGKLAWRASAVVEGCGGARERVAAQGALPRAAPLALTGLLSPSALRRRCVLRRAVNGVTFDEGTRAYLAVGADGSIAAVDGKAGKRTLQQSVTGNALCAAHALTSTSRCVVAGSYLHLLNSSDLSVLCKMSGHSVRHPYQPHARHPPPPFTPALAQAAVRALASTPDGAWALSAAGGDRSVAIFSLAVKASTKPKVRKAKGHLALEDPAVSLACCATAEAPESCVDAFHALAVSETGEVLVWRCARAEGAVQGTLWARICVGAASNRGAAAGLHNCILAAAFEGPNGARKAGSWEGQPVCCHARVTTRLTPRVRKR